MDSSVGNRRSAIEGPAENQVDNGLSTALFATVIFNLPQ